MEKYPKSNNSTTLKLLENFATSWSRWHSAAHVDNRSPKWPQITYQFRLEWIGIARSLDVPLWIFAAR